jgi:uncharacterized protein
MRSKKLHSASEHERTFAVALDPDEEPVRLLTAFATRHRLRTSRITAIGAFSSAVVGFFERARKQYKRIVVDEQSEVLSLLGDIADQGGKPVVHVHVVLGLADGTTRGGHLLEARVWPTLEVLITEWPAHLQRELDPEIGLPLLLATPTFSET